MYNQHNNAMTTFNEIYEQYYNAVVIHVNSQVHDQCVAEEIAQDIFVRISKTEHDESIGSVKTWVFSIVKNAIIDHWRKRRKQTINVDGYVNDDGSAGFDFISNDADPVERKELEDQILTAISGLTGGQQMVVKMFYFENRKQDEIADLLELSVSNVKVTLLRAKTALKKALSEVYMQLG